MKGNFRTLLRKFCLESTILGLKYFYLYPDRLSRCFWGVNMAGVLFLACVLITRLYGRFAEMPTQITIENQYEPLSSLPYPAITLCSPVQVTKSYLRKLNESFADLSPQIDLEKALPEIIGLYEILPDVNETYLFELQTLLDAKNISISELMGDVAQSCSSFLKRCLFEYEHLGSCEEIFRPVLTAQGLCCTFNNNYFFNGKMNEYDPHAITRTVKTPGSGRGLRVVANYDIEDALEGTILSGGAVKVMLSDNVEFPTNRESALVETFTESFHVINAEYTSCSEEVKTLPPDERKCYLTDETQLPFFDKYSKSDCDFTCIVQAIETHCDCLLFYVPHESHRPCNLTSIPCIMKARFVSKLMYSCNCLADCEPRKYTSDIILGNFNAIPFMLNPIYKDLKFNHTSLILDFFFINSVYVKRKQETVISLTIMTSNLGGIFGLCLGCSSFSVLEIIFYSYQAIRNHMQRRWQRDFVRSIEYRN